MRREVAERGRHQTPDACSIMEKGDGMQQNQSTGVTATPTAAPTAASPGGTTDTNTTGTTNVPSLLGVQPRLNSMGDDASGFLAMSVVDEDDKNYDTEGIESDHGDHTKTVPNSQDIYDSLTNNKARESEFYEPVLPPEVIRRVNALRNLQAEYHQLESSFFEEVHTLECRYLNKYQPLYEKRLSIVKGVYEPTDAEAKCAFDGNDEETDDEEKKTGDKTDEKKDEKTEGKSSGIPDFWLQVFKNSDVLSDLIRDVDEPILKHLIDVRIKMHDEAPQKGFTIEFEFTANDYFSNTILTKNYELRTGPDEKDPLSYEGPEIIKSKGCTINWKKDKNVTIKMVKKRQKHKNRGTVRVVTKEVQAESFFNFFNPPIVPDDPEVDIEEDAEQVLAADFEIGHMLRDSIVPKAVLYYTGEAGDDESGDFDEDEDEEDDDEDSDENEDEDEERHGGAHHHGGRGGQHGGKHPPTAPGGAGRSGKSKGAGGGNSAGNQQQPECKQQ
ncbi:unnamed protein product [Didymodactylos carnosus]|uniref:Nucleosome assembly protein 1-like 1 n=1 Tax=Didymodactylos carnosus TaxID=1234261 RepID=A0A813PVI9_9BILA|nr:unnamed protein product [Didymodactylos carnosus]CAF0943178.1 unnamed protein product [Didymodactylos carnosus]CAF3540254.1 unnamed protein product [Didymodactylos carnosus]CAF3717988.1 unnamed protein product [Didymodactylos carnosus]